jgi:hypothetical protein
MSQQEEQPKTQVNNERLQIAVQIAQGLLASQNPETGWNLDTLSILSFKIADNLIHFSTVEKLPELINAATQKENE